MYRRTDTVDNSVVFSYAQVMALLVNNVTVRDLEMIDQEAGILCPCSEKTHNVPKSSIVDVALEAEDLDEWFQIKSWEEVSIRVNEIYEAECGPWLRAAELLDEMEEEIAACDIDADSE